MKNKSFIIHIVLCTILCHWLANGLGEGNFMSKKIFLYGKYGSIIGNYALVDDHRFECLNQFRWYVIRGRSTMYVHRRIKKMGGNVDYIQMHRQILGLTDSNIHVDHKDGNGLNNKYDNIRMATRSQNGMNKKIYISNTSGYKGVSKVKRSSGFKFYARIKVNGCRINIGSFFSAIDAARAYNEMAIIHHGEFASPNIIKTN